MRKLMLLLSVLLACTEMCAQHLLPKMDRGVVAVKRGGNLARYGVKGNLISWRKFAQEPEDAQYKVYINGVLATTTSKTNYAPAALNDGDVVKVVPVFGGVDQESLSGTFTKQASNDMPCQFMSITFNESVASPDDYDGREEMLQGGFGVNTKKGMVFSAGIGHGDRFHVSDIDPDRPGLETYAVQQEDLLGQMIYDAATGEHLHDWYMTEIIDVGRGECMDIDSTAKGYELFSIINGNVYDCKGNVLQGITAPYPYEGIWWSGSRLRDNFASPGGNNYATNINIEKVLGGERYFEISRECNWNIHAGPAVRPMFIGDIIGDWREEFVVLYNPGGRNMGLRGFSTNYPTENSMYCLQEDAHYHGDCTTRGYYQSPNTSFYLGGGMPYPPLPSSMVTDLRWRGGNAWDNSASNFASFDLKTSATFADGKSVMFDISGDSTQIIHLTSTVAPSATYFMVPREHTYNISGGGAIGGTGEIWKSEWGTVNINANFTTSGKTVVSDGILNLNGKIEGPLSLRAKGTLGGNVRLNGNVSFEGALNYEGCRLSPGTPSGYGKMLLSKALNINRPIYVESNIGDNGICDTLRCLEAISIPDTITFTILAKSNKNSELAGTYTLMQASGGLSVNAAKVGIRNLVGMP